MDYSGYSCGQRFIPTSCKRTSTLHYAYLRGFENKQRLAQSIRDKLGLDANNKPIVK